MIIAEIIEKFFVFCLGTFFLGIGIFLIAIVYFVIKDRPKNKEK